MYEKCKYLIKRILFLLVINFLLEIFIYFLLCMSFFFEQTIKENDELSRKYAKVNQDGLLFLIDLEKQEANELKDRSSRSDILIPRSVYYKSREYMITSVSEKAFAKSSQLKSIQFSSDSKLRLIEKDAFMLSSIQSLTIPSSLIELNTNWCKANN